MIKIHNMLDDKKYFGANETHDTYQLSLTLIQILGSVCACERD